MTTLHVLAIGGNSEASLTEKGSDNTLMSMLGDGKEPGRLQRIVLSPLESLKDVTYSESYFSWTGTTKDEDDVFKVATGGAFGPSRIAAAERPETKALLIVGWSHGGDAAYRVACQLGKEEGGVDVLMTLDPVSRLTEPFWGTYYPDWRLALIPHSLRPSFQKPAGTGQWLHAYTSSWSFWHGEHERRETEKYGEYGQTDMRLSSPEEIEKFRWENLGSAVFGNIVAAVGGAWNSQPGACVNERVIGNHGHTELMLRRLCGTKLYRDWLLKLVYAGAS